MSISMKTKTFTFSKEIENKLQTNCTSNLIQIFGNIPIEYFLLHCNTVVDKYMKIHVIVKVYCKSGYLHWWLSLRFLSSNNTGGY